MEKNKLWNAKYKFWYQDFVPEIHEQFVITTGDSISDIEDALKGKYSVGKNIADVEATAAQDSEPRTRLIGGCLARLVHPLPNYQPTPT